MASSPPPIPSHPSPPPPHVTSPHPTDPPPPGDPKVAELHLMFPTVDPSVILLILESSNDSTDRAIEQLLQMTDPEFRPDELHAVRHEEEVSRTSHPPDWILHVFTIHYDYSLSSISTLSSLDPSRCKTKMIFDRRYLLHLQQREITGNCRINRE